MERKYVLVPLTGVRAGISDPVYVIRTTLASVLIILLLAVTGHAQAQSQQRWTNSTLSGQTFNSSNSACIAAAAAATNQCHPGYISSQGSANYQCKASYVPSGPGCHFSTGNLVTVTDCPAGTEWDDVYQQCVALDAPPPVDAQCDAYAQGANYETNNTEIEWVPADSGGQIASFCTPQYSKDDKACQNVMGYIDGHQLCADDKDACEETGGTYGAYGSGDDIYTAICIPDDFADDLPTCDIESIEIIEVPPGSLDGGFACESSITEPFPDDPVETPPEEPDTDGDGIPDIRDPDIDGDGIPNGSDPDADGDGIDNVDDPEPLGEEESENSVSGGGTCAVPPSCVGDPVQCAIVFQTYQTRCSNEALADLLSTEISDEIEGFDPENGPLTDFEGDDPTVPEETDVTSYVDSIFTGTEETSACPADLDISLSSANLTVSTQPMCTVATNARPIVLAVTGFIAFGIFIRGIRGNS